MMPDLADAVFPDAVASYSSSQNFIAGFDAQGTIVWWFEASKKTKLFDVGQNWEVSREYRLEPSGCQIRVIVYATPEHLR